jgi:hypothetical protein
MACPVCRQRKERRHCPALGKQICTICCGTKRLVEIDCTADCAHLAASREHPAAVVRRQQERDLASVLPSIRRLTERQHQLFFLFHTLIARQAPDGLARVVDRDVADATASVASTLETAARGVIYEHVPQSLPAQRLVTEMRTMLAEMRQQGATVYDGEAAIVLRAIEQGARDAHTDAGAGETTYLDAMGRLLQVNRAARSGVEPQPPPGGSIILP